MKKLALAITLALGTTAAHAAVITDSFTNALATTEISQNGVLDLFDSSLGTLNSVTITLNGEAVTDITLRNRAAQSQNVRATASVDLVWSSSLASLDLSAVIMSLSMGTGLVNLVPNQDQLFANLQDSDTLSLAPAPAGFAVAGGGTFTVGCDSLSGLALQGGGGNVDATQNTSAACGAEIAYDYTPSVVTVPVPGTVALLGLGLALLGVAQRRARG